MIIDSIDVGELRIPFKAPFAHASAVRAATQTTWVTARTRSGLAGHGEGLPREYVSGETLAGARAFVSARRRDWQRSILDAETLERWADVHRAEIDAHPAAWAAVELALLDLIGRHEGRTIESVLGVPPISGSFGYTAVLGDAPAAEFEAQLARYREAGFGAFKVKLSGDFGRDRSKMRALACARIAPDAVRCDANNLWADVAGATAYLGALDYGFGALEEPLQAGDYAGMRRLSATLGTKIVLDESMLRIEQLDLLEDDLEPWIVNVRVSKMGGLRRSLRFAEETRRRGVPMIVGAHVGETSVSTRASLTVANACRDHIVAQEGAFGTHLLEFDVVPTPIMFGHGGVLDAGRLRIGNTPGHGLQISARVGSLSSCASATMGRERPIARCTTQR